MTGESNEQTIARWLEELADEWETQVAYEQSKRATAVHAAAAFVLREAQSGYLLECARDVARVLGAWKDGHTHKYGSLTLRAIADEWREQ